MINIKELTLQDCCDLHVKMKLLKGFTLETFRERNGLTLEDMLFIEDVYKCVCGWKNIRKQRAERRRCQNELA